MIPKDNETAMEILAGDLEEVPEVPRSYVHLVGIGCLTLIAGVCAWLNVNSDAIGTCITGIITIAVAKALTKE